MNERSDDVLAVANLMKTLTIHLRPSLDLPGITVRVRRAGRRVLKAIDACAPEEIALLWGGRPKFRDDKIPLIRFVNGIKTSAEREQPHVDAVARVAALQSAALSLHQAVRTDNPYHARHHVSVCWCWLITVVDTGMPVFAVLGSTHYSEAVRRKAEAAFAGRGLIGVWCISTPGNEPWKLCYLRRHHDPHGIDMVEDMPPDFRDDIVWRGDQMRGQWMLASEPEPDPFVDQP